MRSIRFKLVWPIALMLLTMQAISSVWVWHESQSQVKWMADQTLDVQKRDRKIRKEIHETILALLLPPLLLVGASLVFTVFAIRRVTRPLQQLTDQLEHRSSKNLFPLETDHSSLEVHTIIETLNALFSRIQQGMENERRFTADVAHELRTPLAGLRLSLELLARRHTDAVPLVQQIDQMMISIEQLLLLSRTEQRLLKGEGRRVDLLQEVILPMQQEIEEEGFPHPLRWLVESEGWIAGDSGLLFLMLRNLLENVRKYAENSAETMIRLRIEAQELLLEVIDNGPGIAEMQLPALTQRFVRMDESKNGYGLGLNIVERVVQAHQGRLVLQNRMGTQGLHVSIYFPLGS